MTKITIPHIPPITDATATQIEDELKNIGCHDNGDARCTCVIGQDALVLIDQLRRERDAAPTVEQAARALLDAVEAHEEVSDIVFRRMRSNFFLTTLRALAGDA